MVVSYASRITHTEFTCLLDCDEIEIGVDAVAATVNRQERSSLVEGFMFSTAKLAVGLMATVGVTALGRLRKLRYPSRSSGLEVAVARMLQLHVAISSALVTPPRLA